MISLNVRRIDRHRNDELNQQFQFWLFWAPSFTVFWVVCERKCWVEAFNVQAKIDLDLSFDCKCAGLHMWWTLILVSFSIIKLTCKRPMTVTEPSYRKKLLSEVFQSSHSLCTCPPKHTHDILMCPCEERNHDLCQYINGCSFLLW